MLRYYTLRQHYRELFEFPVSKVCIDAGFTCPNRDGSKGTGGCIYCNERGSGAPSIHRELSVSEQLRQGVNKLRKHTGSPHYIVYFQAFTNTYADVSNLEELYRSVIHAEGAVGLAIGTRPDCLDDEKLDLIAKLSGETYVWLEIGLETIHDRTLLAANRRHTYNDFLTAYKNAKSRGIRICLHVIIGLPGESREDIMETARAVGQLEPDGIKIHSLYIESGTKLHDLYMKESWPLFDRREYCEIAAQFLEYLPPSTVIHRLVGEAISDRLFAPSWTKNKQDVLRMINDTLIERNSRQGSLYSKNPVTLKAGTYE
ncbi:TIGR01212 family radical SAM protein [candidate division KSB1 bacterium]